MEPEPITPPPESRPIPMPSARRTWLSALTIVVLSIGAWVVAWPLIAPPPPPVPEDRKARWDEMHREFVATARKGDVDLLFLGDSIMSFWTLMAPAIWSRYYVPRKPANFSIGGDGTEHLLWRLENGELGRLRPKVVVLLIGTNNLAYNTEDEIVSKIGAIIGLIRRRMPDSKILLLGVFPRGSEHNPALVSTTPDPRVAPLNAKLARFDDGKAIRFLDIGNVFLDDSGRILQVIEPDFLHLSQRGYQLWADAMEPTLQEMMEGK